MSHTPLYHLSDRTERPGTGLSRMLTALGVQVSGRNLATELSASPLPSSSRCSSGPARPLVGPSGASGRPILWGLPVAARLGGTAALSRAPVVALPVLGAERLLQLAQAGTFPRPIDAELHTGAEDRGCDPRLAEAFATSAGIGCTLVPGVGHDLPEAYVIPLLQHVLGLRGELSGGI